MCDSKILIYATEPGDTLRLPYVESPDAMIASVTWVEVLGFPSFGTLSEGLQSRLRTPVASTVELSLDDVILCGIRLRQEKKMSLADAIIAATALEYDVPLMTRNKDDFKHLAGLNLGDPFANAA
ncbi:MAG: type II toxin-antitoxin system VapC family toxin [Prosthecobacter sp.]